MLAAAGPPPRRRARPATARVAAVVAVLALLLISYASTVRAYLNQRAEIGAAQAGIAARNGEIAAATSRIEHLSDPGYLQIVGREQFGLVMPGDHSYYVVDDPGARSGAATVPAPSVGGARVTVPGAATWWSRLAGSVGAAAAAPSPAATPKTATPGTAPAGSLNTPGPTSPGRAAGTR